MDQNNRHTLCHSVCEKMVSYFADTLDPSDKNTIETHIGQCSSCKREFTLFQELQRLETARQQGAIDPELLQQTMDLDHQKPDGNIPTLKHALKTLESIDSDGTLPEADKQKKMLISIHHFLTSIRSFLKSRGSIRAGKEWLKLEKRRAKLLSRILNHPTGAKLTGLLALQAEAYVSRGLIFQLHGDLTEAEFNLSQSVVLNWALKKPEASQTQRFMGELKFYEGDLISASQIFINALEKPDTPPREQAILLRNIGNIAYIQNDMTRCKNTLEQAMTISHSLGEAEFPARDLLNLASIDYHRGDLISAIDRTEDALALLDETSDPHLMGQLHANLGTFYSSAGKVDVAETHWKQALYRFRSGYFIKDATQVVRNIALSYYHQGDLTKALDYLGNALIDYCQADPLRVQIELLLARISRLKNDPDTALRHINQTIPLAESLNENLLVDALLLEKAFTLISLNNLDSAKNTLLKSSAMKKSKPASHPSIFDIENEADLYHLHSLLNQHDLATKALKRLKRMIRKFTRSNNSNMPATTALGIPLDKLIEVIQTK